MGKTLRHWLAAMGMIAMPAVAGCSIAVDQALEGRGVGGPDGGPAMITCTGIADGTVCSGGRICVDGECKESECGDGIVDTATGEDCDDANGVVGDGCEDDCAFSCAEDIDCVDNLACNGEEQCSAEHTCVAGEPLSSGDACQQESGDDGLCRGSECVAPGCGNALTDEGEACDDGNAEDGDGCDTDCTFSCTSDAECDDADVCTGTESCNLETHVCAEGTDLPCDDGDACTANECDPLMGCVYPLMDEDMDGHASDALGACGDDCNDARGDVSPSAVELCGDALDSDCDGENNPASTPFWYLDCDDDGYAPLGAVSQQRCDEPPAQPCGGGWTTRVPIGGNRTTYDCNDSNAQVRPNQTGYFSTPIPGASSSVDFDYDCDTVEDRLYDTANVSTSAFCLEGRTGCSGVAGWTGASPVCGATSTYSSCGLALCLPPCTGSSCSRSSRSRTQTCH